MQRRLKLTVDTINPGVDEEGHNHVKVARGGASKVKPGKEQDVFDFLGGLMLDVEAKTGAKTQKQTDQPSKDKDTKTTKNNNDKDIPKSTITSAEKRVAELALCRKAVSDVSQMQAMLCDKVGYKTVNDQMVTL